MSKNKTKSLLKIASELWSQTKTGDRIPKTQPDAQSEALADSRSLGEGVLRSLRFSWTRPLTILAALAVVSVSPLSIGCARGVEQSPDSAAVVGHQKVSGHSEDVAVVGLSAGAFMAVQLGVAYSNVFSGVGSFAGGPYGCAEGTLMGSMTCALNPAMINSIYLADATRAAAALGTINSVQAISKQKVFLYAGDDDKTVKPENLEKTQEFFSAFGASIETKKLPGAAHGMPTVAYGVPCEQTQTPWIGHCGYDGAGDSLSWFWPGLKPAVPAVDAHLQVFDQRKFGSSSATLSDSGFIYTPSACESSGANCRLVVALHGCQQSVPQLGSEFAKHSGFNDWAESNGIIVLYPSTKPTTMNPLGCWDWWGYTGIDYTTQSAPQMSAIVEMVHSLQSR